MQKKLAGVWGGGIAPSPENFSILSLKMSTFSAFWALAHVARGPCPRPSLDPPVHATIDRSYTWLPKSSAHNYLLTVDSLTITTPFWEFSYNWSFIVRYINAQSCNVHPCKFVRLCSVLQCPVLQFQRSPFGTRRNVEKF